MNDGDHTAGLTHGCEIPMSGSQQRGLRKTVELSPGKGDVHTKNFENCLLHLLSSQMFLWEEEGLTVDDSLRYMLCQLRPGESGHTMSICVFLASRTKIFWILKHLFVMQMPSA